MKKVSWIVFVALLLLAGCGTEAEKGYLTVDISQVQQLQDDGAVVLDVREVEEFAEGHIIGAINAPLSKLKTGERAVLDKKQSYIVICRSGSRSKEASELLIDEGYDLVNVSEGMSSWTGEVEY
ncbi:rhodanese-like domain-containing protein [Sporosarcina sp. G11-34]|uniref:rhodanese-like domain-containing protein n=1 Tax=Sporosarcina sp. G11-34 TaxID=2849605 RepID=UPI0022A96D8E|nr:rhodanese-like domain-containing protein [Sporosarcina sp. G11-34]MCZ2259885.1 rhodanese-like domain-containing protein [Sporosarcina sp. G11-34]